MVFPERIKTVEQLEVTSRRVFVRVDFDVPLGADGKILDDTKLRETLPTLKHLLQRGAQLVLASHFGQPKKHGQKGTSLEPAAAHLAELLAMEIVLADDCVGDGARKVVRDLRDGRIAVLENLRWHPEEDANDLSFARQLGEHIDVYVNDAFAVSHRPTASVDALARSVAQRGAGFWWKKELTAFNNLAGTPDRPLLIVLGGARVAEKIALMEALLPRVDGFLLGGAVANTFFAAQGRSVGGSTFAADRIAAARDVLDKASARKIPVLLPADVVVAEHLHSKGGKTVPIASVTAEQCIVDVGPETVELFRRELLRAHSVFWTGTMGTTERREGSVKIARAIAESSGFTVVCGADSIKATQQAGTAARFSHLSHGGEAALEALQGHRLAAVEALKT